MASSKENAPISVIGTGLMRTGTLSLRLALERLLGGKCYHMSYVVESPERIEFWKKASEVPPSDEELRRQLQGFKATVDFPTVSFYQRLAKIYPHAKFILTVRDRDEWFKSYTDTIVQYYKDHENLPDDHPKRKFGDMVNPIIRMIFKDVSLVNEEQMVTTFNRHVEEVKKNVPPEKLLIFEVKSGWEPLCKFLDLPVPDEPFPHANSTTEYLKNFGRDRKL